MMRTWSTARNAPYCGQVEDWNTSFPLSIWDAVYPMKEDMI